MKNSGYDYPDRISGPTKASPVAAFYARRYPHSTEAEWRRRIEAGQVPRNGRPASPDDVLDAGRPLSSIIVCPGRSPTPRRISGRCSRTRTSWSWPSPPGLPVLPGGFFLENTLLYLVRERYGASCSPLHRLGRGTSGAILFTRNRPAARSLATAMFERRILKVYLALASGTAMPDAFTVDAPIGPVPHTLPATLNAYRPGGRPSISHVRVMRRFPDKNASLLEVTIPTGRPHQIRIHLAYAGYPLARGSALSIRRPSPRRRRRRRMDDDPRSDRLSPALLEDPLPPSDER